jgi:hypothetical protein
VLFDTAHTGSRVPCELACSQQSTSSQCAAAGLQAYYNYTHTPYFNNNQLDITPTAYYGFRMILRVNRY